MVRLSNMLNYRIFLIAICYGRYGYFPCGAGLFSFPFAAAAAVGSPFPAITATTPPPAQD